MSITLIVFLCAGLGIVALIGHKHFELATGRKTFISHVTNYTNEHVRTGAGVVQKVNRDNVARVVGWLIAYAIYLLRKAFIYIQNRSYSKKIVDIVSGKHVDKNGPGASLFLKRIKDHDRVDSL